MDLRITRSGSSRPFGEVLHTRGLPMLRMSWRPGRGVLVIEGVVDRDHREVLALASTAAVGAGDVLLVDIEGAQIDAQGRDALKVLELDLWAQRATRVKTTALMGAPKPRRRRRRSSAPSADASSSASVARVA